MAATCTCPDCRHKKALTAIRRHVERDDATGAVHAAISHLQAELHKDRDHRPSQSPDVHAAVAGKLLLLAGLVPTMKSPHRGLLDSFLGAATLQGDHDDAA